MIRLTKEQRRIMEEQLKELYTMAKPNVELLYVSALISIAEVYRTTAPQKSIDMLDNARAYSPTLYASAMRSYIEQNKQKE